MKGLSISLVFVFLGVIIASFVWGVGYIIMEIDHADANQTAAGQIPSFNLQAAGALDYRGIATSSSQ